MEARELSIPPAPPLPPRRWPRALRALRALLADPDDTERAFEFLFAVGPRDFERSFQRFVSRPEGPRLLAEGSDLARVLSDREALAALPEDSLGRAYLAYLDRNGFAPAGLLEIQARVEGRLVARGELPRIDPARAWFRSRGILAHDLFHVLTDYGTDDVGEATLLAFSLGQVRGRGQAVLTLGAALDVWRGLGAPWPGYALRAWRRGRRAVWLAALPWEELLPMRLATVRQLVGIEPTSAAHPGGVLRGQLRSERAARAPA